MNIVVLFTDTHFGVKNNSMTWLNSQLDFIYNQFIPDLVELKKSHPKDRINLVHLGDVFDSRSTISTYVATKVREAFGNLREVVDDFHIIAGNHDYYSPNSDDVCSLDLLLGGLGINLYTKETYLSFDGDLYLPWYEYQKIDPVKQIIKSGIVKRIFTHADIVTEAVPYVGVPIYSGHLHTPDIKSEIGRFNLGSCYSLTFADSNQHRGYYILNGEKWKFVPNVQSIQFWRLYDEDIFDPYNAYIKDRDYIEIYISQSNMANPKYIEKMNSMSKQYKNIWIIPQSEDFVGDGLEKFEGYDIENIVRNTIPDHLKNKFENVLNSLQKSLIMKNE
jgi:DNA repair exonuclease SbcCD nuclease subunit